ncbi:hypothetical protein EAH78_09440 [Pseudomonas arsenicoxydans]|uniref:Uncharacterized protein n=1 Tax=Pseudomonas arsenicoxydans TaxID=702115 RepID=A0A502HYN0_9PSED|nr:hypothetical protein EAH78_09440 [Pseudomonas arsenicoxydans]
MNTFFVTRELAPAGLRSSPQPERKGISVKPGLPVFTPAAQPSGSKLPRHSVFPCDDLIAPT